jgi:hypothetical protein
MSTSKIVGIMALIVFAVGIFLVGNGVAGEKYKCRTVWVTTKWEQINVGDEKDHVVVVAELKGIVSNMEGKTLGDGWLTWCRFIGDMSPTIGINGNGYGGFTDKDGDKISWKFDRKSSGPIRLTFFNGTGKFIGIQGKGTADWVLTAETTLTYSNWEAELELPR